MTLNTAFKNKNIFTKKIKTLIKFLVLLFLLIFVTTIFVSCICLNVWSKEIKIKYNEIKRMSIESIHIRNKISTLITTGGLFKVNLQDGIIEVWQRIEKNRLIAKIMIDKNQAELITNQDQNGFDYVWSSKFRDAPRITISGDLVIRFENIKNIAIKLYYTPLHQKINDSNNGVLALDNDGGIVIVPSGLNSIKSIKMKGDLWELMSNEPLPILLVGVCPPREFDWETSFQPVVHYSSHIERYPTDEQIIEYSKYAKVLEMHSWVWQNRHYEIANKDWKKEGEEWDKTPPWVDLSYSAQDYKWIPDNETEFKRVINTAHANNMKVVPYVNLLDGDIEKHLAEIKRLKDIYNIDGLYIDGLYPENPEIAYEFARILRNLFGNNGWLTLHDTHPSGYFIPFIQSYMDYMITSEHESFNRWLSTSYKISNTIASVWPEISLDIKDGREFLKKLVDDSLLYNNRVILMTGKDGQWRYWRLYFTLEEMEFMKKYYLENLKKMKKLGYKKFISETKTN